VCRGEARERSTGACLCGLRESAVCKHLPALSRQQATCPARPIPIVSQPAASQPLQPCCTPSQGGPGKKATGMQQAGRQRKKVCRYRIRGQGTQAGATLVPERDMWVRQC
jgi:hypothetical protein